MIALYTIMISVFVAYVSFIWARYGVQNSISASYYVLPNNLQILFILFCWGFAFPAVAISMGFSGSLFMFFACSGIVFVGAACGFRDDAMTKEVHMICATIAVILSQIVISLYWGFWYITIGTVAAMLLASKLDPENRVWWGEIAAFTAVGVSFGLLLF